MTLRADVHLAVDDVAEPAGAPTARLVRSVRSMEADLRPPRRWNVGFTTPLRGAGAMVAVLLVILLVGTVLVGGRVWRDWNSFTAGPKPSPQIDQAVLAQLEARPLHLPTVLAGGACPGGPYGAFEGVGSGPVYLQGGLLVQSGRGDFGHAIVLTNRNLAGLVLGRGRDLVTGSPVMFVGSYSAGPVTGTDTVDGSLREQHLELLLDADHPPRNTADDGKLFVWGVIFGLATGSSWCVGFQFDGVGFSEDFVIPPFGWAAG